MSDLRPILLLTRPKAASERFAAAIRNRLGDAFQIVIAPLQQIDWIDPGALKQDYKGLIFTSQNGVLGWKRDDNRPHAPAFCVGPQTTALAREVGLEAQDCDGDAQRLIDRILARQPKTPLLHYRGVHGTGQVAAKLTGAGLPTDERVVYRQTACPPTPALLQALGDGRPVVAPLFSPKSAVAFLNVVPAEARPILAVISPSVAKQVDVIRHGRMMVAKAPNAVAMVGLIEEILRRDLSA